MLPKGLLKEYSQALSMLMRFFDLILVVAAACCAYVYKFGFTNIPYFYWTPILIAAFLLPTVFSFFKVYDSVRGKSLINYFFYLLQIMCLFALLLASSAFFTKSGEVYSREWFAIWMVLLFFFLVVFRCSLLYFLRIMRSFGLNERRVVIFGAGELGTKVAETVQQALWTGFRIVKFVDDAEGKHSFIKNIPVIKTPQNFVKELIDEGIDEIWLALPLRAEKRVKEILHLLRHHTINIRFVLDIFGLNLLNHSITDVAGFPVLNICSTPMSGINRLLKAIEDRLLAIIILILISPILLLIAIAIKLTSKESIFFKQHRLGWDGRIIKIYKFRTMVEHQEEDGKITQATSDDKRITRLGKFLRQTSLDELPQFINVLQGRMSIVGPRPHALIHNEMYKDNVSDYMQRHRVKPGITGWAQINGWRGETDTLDKMQKRVEYDLYYINNWSLFFDLKIILLTFFRGFIGRNAY